MKAGPWKSVEGLASVRLLLGKDDAVENRVAFIEKTPRVRIRSMPGTDHALSRASALRADYLNWVEGPKGSGPEDEVSRLWCDNMLRLLGYELVDTEELMMHSPGPWRDDGGRIYGPNPEGEGEVLICDVAPGGVELTEWDIANARAIAKLPEMVELLHQANGFLPKGLDNRIEALLKYLTSED
jgi:hypothetical protein